ncbi:tetratricopeptide repeat protein [Kordia periserrulae]|uniref:Tetratricopeptide repeat protein n=1 Tax=Kordia periserrulae TaxID=701523 RepID=A0A2T6C6L4_9FLAO|nr:helix-turn-helix domain-containing protein [Kordia periserrulae]PTX63974.1 tetratricopeptide repeat protein [Kordia periserrulae]
MKFLFSRFLACILFLCCFSTLHAQELPKDASLDEMYDFIVQHKYSNPELAKKYAKILAYKSKKAQDNYGLYRAYIQFSKIANIEGNYKLAIQYCDSVIPVTEALKNKRYLVNVYLTKGNAIVYSGNNKEALVNYLHALDITKELGILELEAVVRANIAKIKRRMGFHEEALSIYKNNMLLAKQHDFSNKMILINAYMGVGGTFLRLHQPDSTLVYSEIGLQKSLAINDMEGVSYFYIDIGIAHFIKGNFETAIDYLSKAEKITKRLNNQNRLTEIYYYIGKSYFELKAYDKAISFLRLVETIVNEKNQQKNVTFNPPELLGTYLTLSNAYEQTNQQKLQLEYTTKYLKLKDANEDDDIEVLKELYETAREENNSLTSLTSELKNSLIYVILFSVFAVGLCAFLLYKFLKAKKQNKIIFEKLVAEIETKKITKSTPEFNIEDDKVEAILQRLDKLEDTLFFLNSNCTLQSVAKKLKTNTNYLSKIVNKYKQQKFNEYLNELRIQYVLKRLKEDPKFRNYSIKHIAEEIGYKSTNSFTKYFKASTKLYPSYYIKNLENTKENNTSNSKI